MMKEQNLLLLEQNEIFPNEFQNLMMKVLKSMNQSQNTLHASDMEDIQIQENSIPTQKN